MDEGRVDKGWGWARVWAERTGSDSRQGAKKEKRELRRAVWIEDLGDEGE